MTTANSNLSIAILGRTELEVTRLGYGAMELRAEPQGRPLTSEQAGAVLNAVLDSGINFIDTADCYPLTHGHRPQPRSHAAWTRNPSPEAG